MKRKSVLRRLVSSVIIMVMMLTMLPDAMPTKVSAAASSKNLASTYFNATTKYLHLGDEKTGSFNFNIKKEAKKPGATYTWYVKADKGNPKAVSINRKNGVVIAKEAGTAYIRCKITFADGTYIRPEAKVTVRNNITGVKIKNLPDDMTISAGITYDFNRTILNTKAGKGKKTGGITRWEIQDDTAGVVSASDKGIVYPVQSGEFNIRAVSFQSKAKHNSWLEDKEINKKFITASSDWHTIMVESSDGQAIANTQEQLNKALLSDEITDITLSSEKGVLFTIEEGDYSTKSLTVDTPKADIENHGIFKEITIKDIKDTTWIEYADGNIVYLLDDNLTFVIDKDAKIKRIVVDTPNSVVNFEIHGQVDMISVLQPSQINLSGDSKNVPISIEENAEGSKIASSVSLDLTLNANTEIVLDKGAEETKIDKSASSVKVQIENKSEKAIVITTNKTNPETIESGTKGTSSEETVPTPVPFPGGGGGGGDNTPLSNLTEYNKALMAVVEDDYTVGSWAEYQKVVKANVVTTSTSQTKVDEATRKIKNAQDKLVVAVDSVEISGANTVEVGKTITLTAKVMPENATEERVTWLSKNEDIATVDIDKGIVTGVATGSAIILVTTFDGNKTDEHEVNVVEKGEGPEVLVSAISVTGTGGVTTITEKDGTLQMVATVTPSNASNKAVTWSVENGTGSATITADGVLQALTNGTVTVKATSVSTPAVSKTAVITISNQAPVTPETYKVTIAGDAVVTTDYTISGAADLEAVTKDTELTITAVTAITVNGEDVAADATKTVVINAATTITINKQVAAPAKQLTIADPTITETKTYDGDNTAAVTAGELIGVESGDTVTVTAEATYADAKVGTGKTITVVYTLDGADAAKYIKPVNKVIETGVIEAIQLTISEPTLTKSKVVDGNTTAEVTEGTLAGTIGSDVVTVSAVANYDTADVGTGKTITVVYTLGGADEANYLAPVNTVVTDGEIKAAPAKQLTIADPTITETKTYDGDNTAAVTAGELIGVESGDTVTVTAEATYADAKVGTGKTITVVYTLDGADAAKYIKPVNKVIETGVIEAIQLTISEPTLTKSKVVDGNTTAEVTEGTLAGTIGSDVVTVSAVANYDTADVGTGKTITVVYTLGGADEANYLAPVNTVVTDGEIKAAPAKQLTIADPTITETKTYDGDNTAAVTAGELIGVESGDTVTVTAEATYADAKVGTGKTITVVYTLDGADAAKYIKPVNKVIETGVIEAIQLTISEPTLTKSKVVDGNTTAEVTEGTLAGTIGSDVVTVSAVANYDTADVGTGKTITVVYTLGGADEANYLAPVNTVVTDGEIKAAPAKQLTIADPTITETKTYDGDNTAAVTAGELIGVESGDTVTVTAEATYADAKVGTGKTITVVYTLDGADAAKYIKPVNKVIETGVIEAIQLTISEPTLTKSKVVDGNTTAEVTEGTLAGTIGSDVVTVSAVANYDTADVGTGKTITVVYTLGGADEANYLAPVNTVVTDGEIKAAPAKQLTIADPTITETKTYDGNTTAAVTAGDLTGVTGGDTVTVSAVASYDDKNVGTGKTITVVYALDGTDAAKYIKPVNYTVATGEITAVQLTIAEPTLTTTKEHDGNTTAAVTAGDLTGVIASEDVTVSAVANYDSADVGTNKTITVIYTISGTDAGNYIAPENDTVTDGEITESTKLDAEIAKEELEKLSFTPEIVVTFNTDTLTTVSDAQGVVKAYLETLITNATVEVVWTSPPETISNEVASSGYNFKVTIAGTDGSVATIDSLTVNVEIEIGYFKFNTGTGTITGIDKEKYGNTALVIPESINGVDVEAIGMNAFAGMNFTSVEIPNKVKVIGEGAFKNNKFITVIIPNSVTEIGTSAFYGNELTEVTISNSLTIIKDSVFESNELTEVIIPDSVTKIGQRAFMGNKLTEVIIPATVSVMGANAFFQNGEGNNSDNITTTSPNFVGTWKVEFEGESYVWKKQS